MIGTRQVRGTRDARVKYRAGQEETTVGAVFVWASWLMYFPPDVPQA
jgi:hypothetical protein